MAGDMREIVRGMDPSWYEPVLMKMATDYPKEFYSAFSRAISENAIRNACVPDENCSGIVAIGMTDPPD